VDKSAQIGHLGISFTTNKTNVVLLVYRGRAKPNFAASIRGFQPFGLTVQNMKSAFERYTEPIAEETTFAVISPSCDELE
jgi:hypothetical protein